MRAFLDGPPATAACHRPRHPQRRRDERGTVSVFVVGFAVALVVCAGLVADGGGALNARMKLADDAEQAARAGAQQIDVTGLRESGQIRLDAAAAQQAASQYLVNLGYDQGDVTVNGDEVTVYVEDTVKPETLSLIGVPPFHIHASATAEAVTPR